MATIATFGSLVAADISNHPLPSHPVPSENLYCTKFYRLGAYDLGGLKTSQEVHYYYYYYCRRRCCKMCDLVTWVFAKDLRQNTNMFNVRRQNVTEFYNFGSIWKM